MKQLLLAPLLLLLALPAAAVPAVLAAEESWERWGSGEMRWFGFRLYRATLWVAGGGSLDSAPHALALDYLRDIEASRLVAASIEEMRRLGADAPQLVRWESHLRRVFPSVRKGESIIGVHLPGTGARFFHGGQHLGDIDDPEFARSFFAIWLDARSRDGELRAALLRRGEGG